MLGSILLRLHTTWKEMVPLCFRATRSCKLLPRLLRRRTLQMYVQWRLQLPMQIGVRAQRPWNREPWLVYSQRYSGFYGSSMWILWSSCGLQSCESDVPCDGPMVETYTSYRRSPQHFPFLDNDATIEGLARELPQYIAATQDVVIKCGGKKVECWKVHEEGIPNWSSAVKKVLLVQPSSAAAERFYSLLSSSFNEQQDHVLSDYFQASVMLLSSIRTIDKI